MERRSQNQRFPGEMTRIDAGELKEANLLGVSKLLREAVEPAIENFCEEISMYFGSRRGDRSADEATIRMERGFREKWVNQMNPLSHLISLIQKDRNGLLIIPGWSYSAERQDGLVQTEVCLISPLSKNKFEAIVKKDRERRLTEEERKRALLVLRIQVFKGAELSLETGMVTDPAEHLMEEEKDRVRRIRFFVQRLIKDTTDSRGFRDENFLGVDIKEVFSARVETPLLFITYVFPDINNLPVRRLEETGIVLKKDSFDQAVKTLEEISRN